MSVDFLSFLLGAALGVASCMIGIVASVIAERRGSRQGFVLEPRKIDTTASVAPPPPAVDQAPGPAGSVEDWLGV